MLGTPCTSGVVPQDESRPCLDAEDVEGDVVSEIGDPRMKMLI